MKIRTVSIECKKSYPYQTFACGLTADLEKGVTEKSVIRELQAIARQAVVEQIELEKVRNKK